LSSPQRVAGGGAILGRSRAIDRELLGAEVLEICARRELIHDRHEPYGLHGRQPQPALVAHYTLFDPTPGFEGGPSLAVTKPQLRSE
jgi:hypothetical protein